MKKTVLIITCLMLIGGFLSAQAWKGRARLVGYVYDQKGNPLEGAKVKLVFLKTEDGLETTTDKDGKWVATQLRSGAWHIDSEKIGYAPYRTALDVVEPPGKNPQLKAVLEKVEGIFVTEDLKQALNNANQLFEQKNYPAALEAYSALLAKNPDAYIFLKNIGNCYFAQEQYDKAEESYKKLLEKEPANTDAMLLIGNCYMNRGQTEQALEWYNKIQFESIKDPTVLYNIGTNYSNLREFDKALKYYQRSVELQKDFTDGLYQLGLTYTTLQRNAEAIVAFESYLKADPDSERAGQVKNFLEYLRKK